MCVVGVENGGKEGAWGAVGLEGGGTLRLVALGFTCSGETVGWYAYGVRGDAAGGCLYMKWGDSGVVRLRRWGERVRADVSTLRIRVWETTWAVGGEGLELSVTSLLFFEHEVDGEDEEDEGYDVVGSECFGFEEE